MSGMEVAFLLLFGAVYVGTCAWLDGRHERRMEKLYRNHEARMAEIMKDFPHD